MGKVLMGLAAVAVMVSLSACMQNKGKENGEENDEAKKISQADVPSKVSAAINDRFPGAQIRSVEKENEDGNVVFDYELTQNGRKYEADVKDDGTIMEIEKEVKDVPAVVSNAVKGKYPAATIGDVMEVNKVSGKIETPDHYEVEFKTDAGKKKEVNVMMDGRVEEEGK